MSLFAPEANADAFLVTLHKSEADYSPTTMYQDYAINPELFHWESQSGTTVASKTGQRYLNHRANGSHVLLFTRPQKVSAFGTGAPYLFLGEADYVEHRGERPDRHHLAPAHPDARSRLRRRECGRLADRRGFCTVWGPAVCDRRRT